MAVNAIARNLSLVDSLLLLIGKLSRRGAQLFFLIRNLNLEFRSNGDNEVSYFQLALGKSRLSITKLNSTRETEDSHKEQKYGRR